MINGGAINGAPINEPFGEPFVDWSADIDPITARTYYALEIDDGVLDAVRIPISSWQATVQLGRASYAQAVIQAALQWVDAVNDRADGQFIVWRGVRFPNGDTEESEMARAPLQQINFDQGPTNATLRVSGYRTQPPPSGGLTRTLRNVRSRSVSAAGLRVRCDIDFFLRPGHTAIALGDEFTVAYINYYTNASDEYMDVGERTD